ncbi:MFS general substrate transporter [Metschnikowia bicuspidata var. bicuspidata NRRL YB-4993]|uniref:MFS general substrate transporter n=1 Tax=Metschnikowia bicuspidata var. bicuspidata NRRL YB-4993 TaxID=869754 RepID=A0A1A0H8J6_9ASCO|nr:MFS general substrate transporter [Metschnikowia bicuspidata var. bicuspidata NRRL YB-4993]OBA20439.1 MFS general substrate transporter [Metschnikowia bicuspidata var. bicuspidata NRRL YB-4993]
MSETSSFADSYNPREYGEADAASKQLKNSLSRTETGKSLRSLGLDSSIPQPDIIAPPVSNPIFPEEYNLETETGLVRVETLRSLGRTKSGKTEESSSDKTAAELDPDIELVTFVNNDPENPYNWLPRWKWWYTFVYSWAVISAAYGSSSLAGGLPLINEKYNVSTEVSTLTVSLMVIGFLVGPLLWAPLSEQIGRRPVYIISFFLYTVFNIPVALSPNIGGVLVCRFLLGVFSSSALTNVGASLVDIHNETRGLAIAFFSFCPYSGPVLGGIVNGFISVDSGRYDLMVWMNMAFAGVMWVLMATIPETYAPVILKKRAKRLRKETGNPNIMTEQEASPLSFSELVNNNLVRPLKFIVTEPVLDLICSFVALIYALLYAFFFAYPVIFNELYGYGDDKIGLMYIPILIGAGFAVITTPILESKYKVLCGRRRPTPEDRLVGAMIGSPFPCIALFILGATSQKDIIWVGPASSGIAFGFGMVLIYYSLNNYILDTYHKYAASALATKVFLRSAGGAAFPLFVTQMYEGMGLRWASFLLAFVSLAMVAVPFGFYKYGAPLRKKLCKEDYSVQL